MGPQFNHQMPPPAFVQQMAKYGESHERHSRSHPAMMSPSKDPHLAASYMRMHPHPAGLMGPNGPGYPPHMYHAAFQPHMAGNSQRFPNPFFMQQQIA